MTSKLENILQKGECLSEEMMLNYIEGKLSSEEKHRVEKHLLECDMCADAVEGLKLFRNTEKIKSTVSSVNAEIDGRAKKKGVILFFRNYRIAAIIVLFLIFGGGIWYLQSLKSSEKVFTENFVPYQNKTTPPETTKPDVPLEEKKEPKKEEAPPAPQQEVSGKKKSLKDNEQQLAETKLADKSVAKKVETISGNATYSTASKTSEDVKQDADASTKADDESKNEKTVVTSVNTGSTTVPAQEVQIESMAKKPKEAPSSKSRSLSKSNDENTESRRAGISVADSVSSFAQKDLLNEGIKKYDERDYSGAVSRFDNYLDKNSESAEALFYKGVSELNLDNPKDAIRQLEKCLKISPNNFTDAAKWYLSLAYIKRNKISDAKKLLNELSSGTSEYKSKAGKALLDLK